MLDADAMRACALAVCVLACAPCALAQDVDAAAAALAEGESAELRGEPARAAALFEVADHMAPSPEALRGAIRSHRAAGHLARAATLSVAALERYPEDEETRALAGETLSEARERLGALHVTCPEACAVTLDGRPVGRGTSVLLFVEPGEHRVVASWADGAEAARAVEIEAGTSTDLHLALAAPEPPAPAPEPAPGPPPPPAPRRGIGPELFGVGLAVTAFGLALTAWSGAETLAARDVYVMAPTRARYENGVMLEWRTNGLLIGALAFGAATAILALFTDFGGGALVALAPTPGGVLALVGGSFSEAAP